MLVVIGLLLAGALTGGQQLINSAKVKTYATDFRKVPTMLYAYQFRFKALPGDDVLVVTHLPGATLATTPASLQGNGVINGAWDTATNTDETCLFWQHVRLAGLATGTTVVNCAANADYWPKNPNGGRIGIQTNSGFVTMTGSISGIYIICSENIPGEYVLQLDATVDDGDSATGSMRAVQTSSTGGPPSTKATVQANPGDSFIVCLSI